MADRLHLSYWIRGFQQNNMIRAYEKMLRLFPVSKLSRGQSTLRIHAISFQEPPVLEREFNDPLPMEDVIPLLREYSSPDAGYELETRWDLWQWENDDWSVQPTRASLRCFGPEFDADLGENLHVDFGLDSTFLPQPDIPGSFSLIQSNIRSLLKLVHDLDNAFLVEKRSLWSESGGNFAQRLQSALQDEDASEEEALE